MRAHIKPTLGLIDGDILVYRFGYGMAEHPVPIITNQIDSFIEDLRDKLELTDYEGFLSGPSEDNFRHKIAVTAPYKGQRTSKKPEHYDAIREHLINHWEFTVSQGQEADDDIAIRATAEEKSIIISIDKDFLQVPGWHYNFVTGVTSYVSERQAIRNLYIQILTGDRIDNVIGVKGIGPVKARAILAKCTSQEDMHRACVTAFGGDESRVIENRELLSLLRFPQSNE